MKSTRTLRLRKDVLAELDQGELRQVAGAISGVTCPVADCLGPVTDDGICWSLTRMCW